MKSRLLILLASVSFIFIASHNVCADIAYDQLSWSVQYMIDNSQTVLGVAQADRPRNNRGLALSPDNQYLYAGYNNPSSGYAVRKIDLSQPDYTDATVVNLTGASRGKAIAVDDQGRVYLAEGAAIKVYDGNLGSLQYTIAGTKTEGVTLVRDGGQLALYNSDRTNCTLSKWLLTESAGQITGAALDSAFGAAGVVSLPTGSDLRGVEVDASGRIWVAGYGTNTLYVVAGNGGSYSTVTGISTPMDIGIDGNTALVTTEYNLNIKRVSITDLSLTGSDLVAPLNALELTATPATSDHGAIDCIAVIPGVGFYVSGDGINTANEKSTYGRTDANSGYYEGKFYTDLNADDNDPILFATVPEPATPIILLTGGLIWILASTFRRRK